MTEDRDRNTGEFTFTAFLLGILLAVVFGAANAYLGLRTGLTVSASIPAAVVSMGVLRFVLRRDSILENNMVQTIGSAGESLAAGAIFTLPAIFIWAKEGVCAPPGFMMMTLIALAGGVLGVLFMVPLRRPLISDSKEKLSFPEGHACADVLRAGEKGASHAGVVFAGLALSALLKVAIDGFKLLPSSLMFGFRRLRGALGVDLSPALFGVGFIVGPRIAGLLFAGSFLGWMVLIPVICAFSGDAAALYADGGASAVWGRYLRYVGAGAIATGGMTSFLRSVPLLRRTFSAMLSCRGRGYESDSAAPRMERDLPLGRVIAGIVCVVVLLWAIPSVPVGFAGACMMALFGFFFSAVSARMVGYVGSSNNPVSGMAIATLVVASLVLKTAGVTGAAGMVAALSVGSVVCIVAAMAGDTAQDLKTGHILGATPWRQQIGELVGALAAAGAIGGTLWLLDSAWGFGGNDISAPQATLMKMIVEGVMVGDLPWSLIGVGCVIALVLELLRIPVMPVAIGLYLPVQLNGMVFIGGLVRLACEKMGRRDVVSDTGRGTLLSAGLVAGEGIAGIALAVWKIAAG